VPLIEWAARAQPRSRALSTLLAVIEAVEKLLGTPPAIDAGLVAVASALGLPTGAAAGLFAVGRAAGWAAHVFEQRTGTAIFRPRARYVGPARPAAT
jgi:citrate synthase